MSRIWRLASGGAALLTVTFAIVLALRPFGGELALELYLLALAALLMAAILGGLATEEATAFDASLDRVVPTGRRPAQLEEVEWAIELARASPADFDMRLRPLLREVAAARLATRGIDLESRGARAMLGERYWDLLRTDRRAIAGPGGGVDERELLHLVEFLETV